MKATYWMLWSFDALITLVVIYFFIAGICDRSVGSFNITLWCSILAIAIGIPLMSLWLKSRNYLYVAKLLLWIMAIPGLFYLLFILIFIIGKTRMN